MSTLLVNAAGTDQDGFTNPPLNLLYLASTLLANGEEVDIVDGCIDGYQATLAAARRGYDVVGVNALTPGRFRAIDYLEYVKRVSPKSITVIGGVHPSIQKKQMQEAYGFIDHVVAGEGEKAILSIANGGGAVEGVMELDSLPPPAWSKVDLKRYPPRGRTRYDFLGRKNGVWLAWEPRVSVIFSRGCTAHCVFCSAFWVNGKYRVRDPLLMADELQDLHDRYGVHHISFADDLFSSDREKTLKLCKEIVDRKLRLAFHVTTRVDCIDEEVILAMKEAGCYEIALGIETGSESLLQKIHKSTTVEAGERAIALARRSGIFVNALLIVGSVGETMETVKETTAFLRRSRPHSVSASGGLWIFPGTAVYHKAKMQGLIDDSFWLTRTPFLTYLGEHTKEDLARFQDIIWSYSAWVYFRRKVRKILSRFFKFKWLVPRLRPYGSSPTFQVEES